MKTSDLEKLTVTKLREMARKMGIPLSEQKDYRSDFKPLRKAELIQAIIYRQGETQ